MTTRASIAVLVLASVALVLAVATLAYHRAVPVIFTDTGPRPDSSSVTAWLTGVALTASLTAYAMTMRTARRAAALAIVAGCLALAFGVFTAASDDRLVRWEYARACVERGVGFWCFDPNDPSWRADAENVPGPLQVSAARIALVAQSAELALAGVVIAFAVVRRGRSRGAGATSDATA